MERLLPPMRREEGQLAEEYVTRIFLQVGDGEVNKILNSLEIRNNAQESIRNTGKP